MHAAIEPPLAKTINLPGATVSALRSRDRDAPSGGFATQPDTSTTSHHEGYDNEEHYPKHAATRCLARRVVHRGLRNGHRPTDQGVPSRDDLRKPTAHGGVGLIVPDDERGDSVCSPQQRAAANDAGGMGFAQEALRRLHDPERSTPRTGTRIRARPAWGKATKATVTCRRSAPWASATVRPRASMTPRRRSTPRPASGSSRPWRCRRVPAARSRRRTVATASATTVSGWQSATTGSRRLCPPAPRLRSSPRSIAGSTGTTEPRVQSRSADGEPPRRILPREDVHRDRNRYRQRQGGGLLDRRGDAPVGSHVQARLQRLDASGGWPEGWGYGPRAVRGVAEVLWGVENGKGLSWYSNLPQARDQALYLEQFAWPSLKRMANRWHGALGHRAQALRGADVAVGDDTGGARRREHPDRDGVYR